MKKIIVTLSFLATIISIPTHTKKEVVYLFAHGIADTKAQAYNYTRTYVEKGKIKERKHFLVDGSIETFNFPDATGIVAKVCRVNFTQTDLAQEEEIKALSKAYHALRKKYPDCIIVIIALSRGAATTLSWAALEQPHNVIIIAESPFSSLMGIVKDKWSSSYIHKLARFFLSMRIPIRIRIPLVDYTLVDYTIEGLPFFKHKLHGIKPINLAPKIPRRIPIQIILSDQDKTVPPAGPMRVVKALQKASHPVEIVHLKKGMHAHLLDGPEGALYMKATQQFLEKHIATMA